jgi:serine/threonine-protein kinase RsbW
MKIEAKIESLPEILTALHEKGSEFGLKNIAIHQLEIAMEELIVNIIQHGYQNEQKTIEVEFSKLGSQFCVKVRDFAPPFNLIEKSVEIDTNAPLEERKMGGLGLLFIKKFTDYLEYRRLEDGNEIKMFKEI